MSRLMHVGAVAAFAAAVVSCSGSGGGSTGVNGGGGGGGGNMNSTGDILVENNFYAPDSIRIAAGDSLTWGWSTCSSSGYGGQSCGTHSVTFDDGPASATQPTGTYKRVFLTAGTYTYHCAIHGLAMSGKVVVQ